MEQRKYLSVVGFVLTALEMLASAIMFGAVAYGVGALFHWWFPDPSRAWDLERAPETGRAMVAALLVATPLWLAARMLLRRFFYQATQHVLRWWLIGGGVVVLAFVAIISLIKLVSQLLGGNAPLATSMQLLVLLLFASLIATGYAYELWRGMARGAWFERIVGGGVLVVSVATLLSVGSPILARALERDEQRVADLFEIVSALREHYDTTHTLPLSLDQVQSERTFSTIDPLGNAYIYQPASSSSVPVVELCATFEAPSPLARACESQEGTRRAPLCRTTAHSYFALHPAGYFCQRLPLQEKTVPLPPEPRWN